MYQDLPRLLGGGLFLCHFRSKRGMKVKRSAMSLTNKLTPSALHGNFYRTVKMCTQNFLFVFVADIFVTFYTQLACFFYQPQWRST